MVKRLDKYYNLFIFTLLVVITLLLRNSSFYSFNLDDDEGIYLLMGKFILNGHLPYIHYFDHQPPFIYFLSSLVQFLGFKSVLGIRILGACFVGATGFYITKLLLYLLDARALALIGGVFYVFTVSNNNVGGLAFNNEIIFNLFTALSLYHLLNAFNKKDMIKSRMFLAGLICGFGFFTKQQVLYDFITFNLLIFSFYFFKNKNNKYLQYIPIFTISSLIPLIATSLLYLVSGYFQEYVFAVFTSNIRYISAGQFNKDDFFYFLNNLDHYIFLLPPVLFPFFIKNKNNKSYIYSSWFKFTLLFWLSINFYGISLSKNYYLHYVIQILLPVSIVLTYNFSALCAFRSKLKHIFIMIYILCLIIFVGKNIDINHVYTHYKESALYNSSNYIIKNKKDNDSLFVVNGDVMHYYFTNLDIITRFAFPIHLIDKKYEYAFDLDQEKELLRVFSLKPVWLIIDNSSRVSYRKIKQFQLKKILHENLKNYKKVKIFKDKENNEIEVWHLSKGT